MSNREIIISPNALHVPKVVTVGSNLSIREIIKQCNPEYSESLIVEINGNPVTRDKWDLKPDVNDHVLVYAPVMGGGDGKNPLRTLLMIAVVVAAIAIPGALPALGQPLSAIVSAGVATAGMLLVDAIAPIKAPQLNSTSDPYSNSPTYSISGGSNRANPWGAVPLNLGVNRAYPPLGSGSYTEIIDEVETVQKYVQPTYNTGNPSMTGYPVPGYVTTYTEIVGSDEYFRMLVIWGYGPLDISSIKIGDTLLSSYSDYDIETNEGWSTDTALTLFPSQVQQETVGVILTQVGGMVQRTAEPNVDELSVDLAFPSGLVEIEDNGDRSNYSVTVLIQYREVGAGGWTTHETKVFTDKTTSVLRYGTSWTVDNTKEYEIGITRQTADSADDQILDDVYWVNFRSVTCDDPLGSVPYPVAASAIKIKATDQLNGPIDTLNAIVSSYVPVWDDVGEEWGADEEDYEISNNPAALFRHVLTCDANAKARTTSQIDDTDLGAWYEFCDTNGYAFNLYKDTQSSVWETLSDIAAAGRASPALIEGLWTVAVDTGEQSLIQHITPRTSWGFSSEKILFDPPHAFRIRFVNEDNSYQWDERIVYDDGYNSENATLFESITLVGITDPDLIWKFGRFHIAQARLRPERYTLNMDFEHLACTRGSKVRVSHDVPLWGVGSGRVKALTLNGPETHITHVTLDEYVTMEGGNDYVCRFRLVDGSTLIEDIVLDAGETNVIEFDTPVLVASGPEVGDLFMFGIDTLETVELLVESITRSQDLTAQLTLVDFAEDIYDADTGEIPAFSPSMTTPTDVTRIPPDPPTIDSVSTGLDVTTISGGGSVSTINVYLTEPADHIKIRGYRVRFRLVDETVWTYMAESKSLTIPIYPVSDQLTYEIQAQSISVYGLESQWTSVETGSSDTPQIVPDSATGISVSQVDSGSEYNFATVVVEFTPPDTSGVYAYTEIYGCTDDATYEYLGRDSTGEFHYNGLGGLYKIGDTLYIKVRSVSKYEVRESLPVAADDSVVIQNTTNFASFYFGHYDMWGGNAAINNAATTIVLGNLDGVSKLALGPSADSLTLANVDTLKGFYADGDGNFRHGGPSAYGVFDATAGTYTFHKVTLSSDVDIEVAGTSADTWTINSDQNDVTTQLILGRTTGGNLYLLWNGTNATLSSQTIADNSILTVDHASATDNDFAKFTAYGLEGRSYAEVLSDLSGQAGGAFDWNSQNLTSVGDIGAGTNELTIGSINRASGTLTLEIGGTAELSVATGVITVKDGGYLKTDKVMAYDSAGLSLFEDGGKGIFVQDATGNVGIGTTAPTTKLVVKTTETDSGFVDLAFFNRQNSDTAALRFSVDGSSRPGIFSGNADLYFGRELSGTENIYMTIKNSDGNVGIGTTSPRKLADFLSTSQAQLRLSYADNSVYADFQVGSGGNLTISPTGDLVFDPTGNDVYPNTNYDINLGLINKKFLTLHAAELWVETLVAQDTMATIGGRILIGPTTKLTSDLGSGDTTMYVEHNNLANGDRVYMEADSKVEFIAVASAPGGTGPYSYTITRNLDGTGANDWYAGDAVFNTGTTGDGFIDIYSISGVKSGSEYGPTIVGNIRNSATYNDWTEAWAIGNLNGLYGYGSDTYGVAFGKYSEAEYLTIDPTNGIRFFDSGDVVRGQLSSGEWTLGYTTNEHVKITNTAFQIKDGANVYTDLTAGVLTLGLTSGGEYVLVDSTGIEIYGNATKNFEVTSAGLVYVGYVAGGEYVQIDSTGVEIYGGGTKVIDIDSSGVGSINLLAGGNLTLTGHDSTPGKITYAGSSYTTDIYSTTSGIFYYKTYSDENHYVQLRQYASSAIGYMQLYAYNNTGSADTGLEIIADSSGNQVVRPSSNIDVSNGDNTYAWKDVTTRELIIKDDAYGGGIFLTNHKYADAGENGTAFDDMYADDYNNVADFFFLDDKDDISVLHNIKGSGIIDDRTGLELIDDDTLPEWMLVRHKQDTYDEDGNLLAKKGEIATDPEGKPYISTKMWDSLLAGAIRELDKKYEDHLNTYH